MVCSTPPIHTPTSPIIENGAEQDNGDRHDFALELKQEVPEHYFFDTETKHVLCWWWVRAS